MGRFRDLLGVHFLMKKVKHNRTRGPREVPGDPPETTISKDLKIKLAKNSIKKSKQLMAQRAAGKMTLKLY